MQVAEAPINVVPDAPDEWQCMRCSWIGSTRDYAQHWTRNHPRDKMHVEEVEMCRLASLAPLQPARSDTSGAALCLGIEWCL
ncbi:MAG: hypothetical protein ACKVQA_26380 [Burkholderiales bacterium]